MNEPESHDIEPSDDHSALIQRFRATMRGQRVRGCVRSGVGGCTGCLTLFLVFIAGISDLDSLDPRPYRETLMDLFLYAWPGWLIGGAVFIMAGLQLRKVFAQRELRELAADLAASNDVWAIGPLLEARELKDRKVRQIANQGLLHLLPMVGPEHTGLLGASEWQLLHYALYGRDPDFLIAAVRALKHVGNANSAWYLAGLAGDIPYSYSFVSNREDLRIESAAALQYLNERLERQRLGRTLLRPVNATYEEETLLRPAGGLTEQPQDQLLRPTTQDSE